MHADSVIQQNPEAHYTIQCARMLSFPRSTVTWSRDSENLCEVSHIIGWLVPCVCVCDTFSLLCLILLIDLLFVHIDIKHH